jgi:O-antigen/teichoic acid export membrane protein
MKRILQVLFFDIASKAIWAAVGLALIRFLPVEQFAILTWTMAAASAITAGVATNLNKLYIVGYERLDLQRRPQLILALEVWIIALAAAPTAAICGAGNVHVWLIAGAALTQCLLEFVQSSFQREMRFTAFSLIGLARSLSFAVLLFALVLLRGDSLAAWQVLTLQIICLAGVAVLFFGRGWDLSVYFQWRELIGILRAILFGPYRYLVAYFLCLAAFARLDIAMLGWLDAPLEVATYGSAFRYFGLLMILLNATHTVFLPLTQQAAEPEQLRATFKKYYAFLAILVPLVLVGACFSEPVIAWIDGGRYPQAASVFQVLAATAVVSLACSPSSNVIFRYEQFRFLFLLVCFSAAVNAALNLFLITRYHAWGAAVGLFLSFGILNVGSLVKAWRLMQATPLPHGAKTARPTALSPRSAPAAAMARR